MIYVVHLRTACGCRREIAYSRKPPPFEIRIPLPAPSAKLREEGPPGSLESRRFEFIRNKVNPVQQVTDVYYEEVR